MKDLKKKKIKNKQNNKNCEYHLLSNELITLSNSDRDIIIKILENPPEPTDTLKKLFH